MTYNPASLKSARAKAIGESWAWTGCAVVQRPGQPGWIAANGRELAELTADGWQIIERYSKGQRVKPPPPMERQTIPMFA